MVGKRLANSAVEQGVPTSSALAIEQMRHGGPSRIPESRHPRSSQSNDATEHPPAPSHTNPATERPTTTAVSIEFRELFPEPDQQTLDALTWAGENSAHPKVKAWLKSCKAWNDEALEGRAFQTDRPLALAT